MYQRNSEDLYNAIIAQHEANQALAEEQAAALNLADKTCIERIIAGQFAQVRKAAAVTKGLQRKANRMAKGQYRMAKQIAESKRRQERQMKRLEQTAYLWSALDA